MKDQKGGNGVKLAMLNEEIVENIIEGAYFVDKERTISTWNHGAEEITGFSSNEVVNRKCYDNILNHVDENGVALCFQGCPLQASMGDGIKRETNIYIQHKDGHRVPILVRAIPLFNEKNEVIGAIEFFNEYKNDNLLMSKIERYRKESSEDQLTKIPNRRYLETIIESKIRDFYTLNTPFGICFLDIDNFKKVNDTYGHDIGDEILKIVTKTVQSNLRNNDYIGRWGGEEFIIIFSNVDKYGISKVSEKVRHLIEKSKYRSSVLEVQVSVSIGATISLATDTVESIVKRADELMYKSKLDGKNKVTLG